MKKKNLNTPATKTDVEEATTSIAQIIVQALESYPTKDEINSQFKQVKIGFKQVGENLKQIDERLSRVESDVTDIKRDVEDLKRDTPTQAEFEKLKKHCYSS